MKYSTNDPVILRPDQMPLTGDAKVKSDCTDPVVCAWLASAPEGSILPGIDPAVFQNSRLFWGAAEKTITLPLEYAKTCLVLTVSSSNVDGKGIHSPISTASSRLILVGSGDGTSELYTRVLTWITSGRTNSHPHHAGEYAARLAHPALHR